MSDPTAVGEGEGEFAVATLDGGALAVELGEALGDAPSDNVGLGVAVPELVGVAACVALGVGVALPVVNA